MPAATLSGSGAGACGAADPVAMRTTRIAEQINDDFIRQL
jgi:hypothetical protein